MASTGEVWRLGHRPALDGLRGLAVLLVLVNHTAATPSVLTLGSAGVTAFFVLSGFLITAPLLEEREATGSMALPHFYARRARRLMPALLACSLVTALVAIPAGELTLGQLVAALTYTTDFVAAGDTQLHGALGHTWSLAIEEQFYLLWPFALLALRSRRTLLWALSLAAGGVVVWRVTLASLGASAPRLGYAPDTRADALLIGCLLAALLVGRRATVAPRGVASIALLGLLATGLSQTTPWSPLVASLCAAALIWSCVTRDPLALLNGSAIRYVGRRSYGLYLWHYPVMVLTLAFVPGWSWEGRTLVWLPVAVLLTAASWRYVEEPFQPRRAVELGDSADEASGRDAAADLGTHRGEDRRRRGAVRVGKRLDVVAGG